MPADDSSTPGDPPRKANPGYPAFQIARALNAGTHQDPEVRQRIAVKASRWKTILTGMLSGALNIGSRRPLSEVPVWATPEVMTGGFATGALMAAGEILPHEREISARVAPGVSPVSRDLLNRYYLTEEGLAELAGLLESGCYRIPTPEEGALLSLAWLFEAGRIDEAGELLQEILPYFGLLRFYPQPAAEPQSFGQRVSLESIAQVRERLGRMEPPLQVLVQRETIKIWIPLHRRMIDLFLETVEGDHPVIQPDADNRWADPVSRRFHTIGGWPCRIYPSDWRKRAEKLLEEISEAWKTHRVTSRPGGPGQSFSRLQEFLKRCAANPASLSGRDVGSIRLILAKHLTRNGEPGSERDLAIQDGQQRQIAGPFHSQLASAVGRRLAGHPAEGGLDDIALLLLPITPDEEARDGTPAGSAIPASVERKILRCLLDTPEGLIGRGIITSGESLARIIPGFTAALRAQAFTDSRVARLYASVDVAFRSRRSLLLLNLESQVRLGELPWIRCIDRHRPVDSTIQSLAFQALRQLAILTLSSFPQAILPNQLLKDFRALARTAEIHLPITEEIAADIFMGDFTPTFSSAARLAAASPIVENSVYSRYYGIDCEELLRRVPQPPPAPPAGTAPPRQTIRNPLAALCEQRANLSDNTRPSIARNGMILEQAQILTSHNLAALFEVLSLSGDQALDLPAMAERCFRWICKRQQVRSSNHHARLIMLKNTAYAWRQMVFFLAATPARRVDEFLVWAADHLSRQHPDFKTRFEPVMAGLHHAHTAGSGGKAPTEILRFTGWSQGNHPLW